MTAPVYILGGHQTDFARNWTKEGKHIAAMCLPSFVQLRAKSVWKPPRM